MPSHLRNVDGYKGRTFVAIVAESVQVQGNYWSEGSRSYWSLVRLSDGKSTTAPTDHPCFDARGIEGSEWPIPAGFAVVEHVIFRGKDLGLRFYLLPADVAPLLSAPAVELSDSDGRILAYFASWRSCPERKDALRRVGYDDVVRDRLAAAGLLKVSRNGATRLTVKGRNACQGIRI